MAALVHPVPGPAAPWGVAYTGKANRMFGWHDDTFLIWTDLLPLTVFIGLGGACLAFTDGFYQVSLPPLLALSLAPSLSLTHHPFRRRSWGASMRVWWPHGYAVSSITYSIASRRASSGPCCTWTSAA